MTHTNLTINELVCIDAYAENGMKGYKIAQKIKRSPQNNGVSREVLGAREHDHILYCPQNFWGQYKCY